jgi:hypothetical protein
MLRSTHSTDETMNQPMMYFSTLSIDDLSLSPDDLYREMGYGDTTPDDTVRQEAAQLFARVAPLTHPRFGFLITEELLITEDLLITENLSPAPPALHVGKTIARQLRGSEAYALFVATAGEEYEAFQQQLKEEGDLVSIYLADALGSVIAEKTADQTELALQRAIDARGWQHTNRFSPGYCGWDVAEQHRLFARFPAEQPCGIRLTDAGLMLPIKSVSGIIGLGAGVRKRDYACRMCRQEHCFRRRK